MGQMNRRRFLQTGAGLGARGAWTCLCAVCTQRMLFAAVSPFVGAFLPGCGGGEPAAATPAGNPPPAGGPGPSPSPSPLPSPTPLPSPSPAPQPPPQPPSTTPSPPANTQTVSVLAVEAEDPTNANALMANVIDGIKHQQVIDNQSGKLPANYSAADRKLFLGSGDFPGWPSSGARSDFPFNTYQNWGGYNTSGRQDIWFADISDSALAGGKVRWKLAQNLYHNYPYANGQGYFGAGRPGGGVEPERGPYMPDAQGFIVDKRGDFWVGPCDVGYDQIRGDAAGADTGYWAAMYRWRMPPKHPVSGVRLGGDGSSNNATKTGWHRPPQQRLKRASADVEGGVAGRDWDVASDPYEMCGWGRPNTTVYDPNTDKIYLIGMFGSNTQLTPVLYSMSLDPAVVASQGGQYRWTRELLAPLGFRDLGVTSTITGTADWVGDKKSANASSVAYCNGSLYFPFVHTLYVSPGQGNVAPDRLRKAWILSINLTTRATGWVPFPSTQNWWLRAWDGPLAAAAFAYDPNLYGTTAQYRSLKAVGNKIVIGPDNAHNVTQDPWISAYDTASRTWTSWAPPASYPITNGGHDWPMSIFNLAAVPSLGEVWLVGSTAEGDDFAANDSFLVANGLHRRNWYQDSTGLRLARRIIRFKVT
jgi:hypothetical protein